MLRALLVHVLAPAMATHGHIELFDVTGGNWSAYELRLTQYLAANGIDDNDLKRATMLTVIGGPAFELLQDLLAPNAPTDKTFAELCAALKGHLAPKPLVIGERYRFYQRDQRPGESIAAYVAELRRLARTCEFNAHLAEALRDRFVCGLRSAGTRRKLLATDALTFDNAVKDALADELATRDALEVSATDTKNASGGVHKLRTPSRKPVPGARSTCFRCGGVGHKAPDRLTAATRTKFAMRVVRKATCSGFAEASQLSSQERDQLRDPDHSSAKAQR